MESPVVAAVRAALRAAANPQRAAGQQRYMRSAMPFHGLTSPELRDTLRDVWAAASFDDAEDWRGAVLALWDGAGHREERYAALALLRLRRYAAWARTPDPALISLLRHCVVTGAWWDLVDPLASDCVGVLLRAAPDEVTPIVVGWAREEDLWLRRTAILCQLGSKGATDTALLAEAIAGSWDDPDFFARKAIGWALRQHARTDPAWVTTFVQENRNRLSPLSIREALKHLGT